eukprot:TRINITY_DN57743_c0_g1_i1.p1 TRINITY_DN57743_c0_g1~~TRINITY_DN57743_c0_g1_i1.p1  ORF type:complete len:212 (+),score=30.43 TRINITY_DN57743_c0_g1_i1:83-718(+)
MCLSFETLPDDVVFAILEAHGTRCDARAVTPRLRTFIEQHFRLRRFAPPSGQAFCLDIEVDHHMTKSLYCAQFGGTNAGEAGGVAGEVTFVKWLPAYFRTVANSNRGLNHEIKDSDACALWRTISKVREVRERGGSIDSDVSSSSSSDMPREAAQGYLVLSEGEGAQDDGSTKMGNRQVIGRLSQNETDLVMKVVDHRRNPSAVLREAIMV